MNVSVLCNCVTKKSVFSVCVIRDSAIVDSYSLMPSMVWSMDDGVRKGLRPLRL